MHAFAKWHFQIQSSHTVKKKTLKTVFHLQHTGVHILGQHTFNFQHSGSDLSHTTTLSMSVNPNPHFSFKQQNHWTTSALWVQSGPGYDKWCHWKPHLKEQSNILGNNALKNTSFSQNKNTTYVSLCAVHIWPWKHFDKNNLISHISYFYILNFVSVLNCHGEDLVVTWSNEA